LIKAFVRGGNELGTLTISRFFVKMADSGMQPLDIPDDDLAALTAYVSGLK